MTYITIHIEETFIIHYFTSILSLIIKSFHRIIFYRFLAMFNRASLSVCLHLLGYIYTRLHEFNVNIKYRTLSSNMTSKSDIPVRPHQVGHPLFIFTTNDENMRRNSNHLTSHIVMLSCCRNQRSRDTGNHTTGAIIIARKPTSSSSMSLHHTVKRLINKPVQGTGIQPQNYKN